MCFKRIAHPSLPLGLLAHPLHNYPDSKRAGARLLFCFEARACDRGSRAILHFGNQADILERVFMGVDGVLVSFPVFKTEWAARVVAGGFDSHTLPPRVFRLSPMNVHPKSVSV